MLVEPPGKPKILGPFTLIEFPVDELGLDWPSSVGTGLVCRLSVSRAVEANRDDTFALVKMALGTEASAQRRIDDVLTSFCPFQTCSSYKLRLTHPNRGA